MHTVTNVLQGSDDATVCHNRNCHYLVVNGGVRGHVAAAAEVTTRAQKAYAGRVDARGDVNDVCASENTVAALDHGYFHARDLTSVAGLMGICI